jgi:oligopeptidase A
MTNALLDVHATLPDFNAIKVDQIKPALDEILKDNREAIAALLTQTDFSWSNFMAPLEALEARLDHMWSTVEHLHAVKNDEAIRAVYAVCIADLTAYHTENSQNEALYLAVKHIAESDAFEALNPAQQKILQDELRDFKLAGVHLKAKDKKRFARLQADYVQLTTQFENHVLDATHDFQCHITDESRLKGLPQATLDQAKKTAESNDKPGWVFSLDFPVFHAIMQFADDADLRQTFYEAYCTKASDQGPGKGQWDNSEVMTSILTIRQDLARLVGFEHYAAYSLATKMADEPKTVLDFLTRLAHHAKPFAEKELASLQVYASEQFGQDELAIWDFGYYSEKYRQAHLSVSQEALRPYFPLPQVLSGLFTIVNRLYGIDIVEKADVSTWHDDVQYFEISQDGEALGGFYTDLYARTGKRGGAWMAECRTRRRLEDGGLQLPIAYLNCNFSAPAKGKPGLLTHDEAVTLFHEFGHGLHHLLTTVEYLSASGINGVPWDAVELPSQFMENWCWQKEALGLIARHYETGDALSDDQVDKLLAAKNFQVGLQTVRQIEFALFDFTLHMSFDASQENQIQTVLDEVRQTVSVLKPPAFNRFQHSFSHIFAGGYAAGYYSYKWAEVLASDAFSRFEEDGIFNATTGQAFLANILSQGGSANAMDLFVRFRGREPEVESLLKQSGLV